MRAELFDRFTQLLGSGLRAEAGVAIRAFVASFEGLEDRRRWSERFLATYAQKDKIRHELYEGVIFPALLDAYRRAEPWGLRGLARTAQNLYQSQDLWRQVEMKSDWVLLSELLVMCPDDLQARKDLLDCHVNWLRYVVHEWPAGMLYGTNGATFEECGEIQQAMMHARELDVENVPTDFLDDFETKLAEYTARILRFEQARAQTRMRSSSSAEDST